MTVAESTESRNEEQRIFLCEFMALSQRNLAFSWMRDTCVTSPYHITGE